MAKRKKRREFKYPIISWEATDGDTVEALLDRGESDYSQRGLRVVGIDAPERRRKRQRKAAIAVMDVTDAWLDKYGPLGLSFISTTRAKYKRRMIGHIRVEGSKALSKDLGRFLLSKGIVREYFGGKRKPWPTLQLDLIYHRAVCLLSEMLK